MQQAPMRFDGLAACFSLSEMGRRIVGAYRSRRATHSFWNDCSADRLGYEFYRQFIGSGSLVFDIGANIGTRSKIFWQLGAQVVAIEPQPECAAFLRKVFAGRQRFELIEVALGAIPGQGEMLISNANTVSSLSNEWVKRVRDSGRFPECTWDKKLSVPIQTLDHLISTHGAPAFVKIDVEGFEEFLFGRFKHIKSFFTLHFSGDYISACFHIRQIIIP
jgi:FkbM family methyltransferase